MKFVLTSLALAAILVSCADEEKPGSASGRKIAARNLAITDSNAVNPVFLDSAAMEKFFSEQKLSDTLSDGIRSFYNNRNYQFAWIDPNGLSEQAMLFKSMYDFGNDSGAARKKLDGQIDGLATRSSLNPKEHLKTELMMSWRFIQYVDHLYDSEDERNEAIETFVPAVRTSVTERAARILEHEEEAIRNEEYARLEPHVKKYMDIVNAGGWPKIAGKEDVPAVKKRLSVTGDFTNGDTSASLTEDLKTSISGFQSAHGLKADGTLSEETISAMNVPAEERLRQLVINLERMRWMPVRKKEVRSVLVNIPEFILHAWENGDTAFNMNVVVGKEANSTILFASTMNNVVFSPYWNLPRSIVQNEVLPAMEKNKNYLDEKNMEQTGEENGLPVIRQKPGEGNALGKVKFLFPNSFSIYFHDTPQKELFNREMRAFSHGCIRLADPEKMARYCLEGMEEWTPEKITEAMNSGEEKWVKLKNPVQVQIAYYTSWVDPSGVLQFRKDIYDHDQKSKDRLFM